MDVIVYFENRVRRLENQNDYLQELLDNANAELEKNSADTSRGFTSDLTEALGEIETLKKQIMVLEKTVEEHEQDHEVLLGRITDLQEENQLFLLAADEEKARMLTQFETYIRKQFKFRGSLKTFIQQVMGE